MDFIEGLPKLGGKDVVLVVVNRSTKYAHFIALPHPYTANTISQTFIDQIFRLPGLPATTLPDRDEIFTSQLWMSIFKAMEVSLQYSSAYHPYTDG
jgi:hypothetical protein